MFGFASSTSVQACATNSPVATFNALPETVIVALPFIVTLPVEACNCTPVTGTSTPTTTVTFPSDTFNALPVTATVAPPFIVEVPRDTSTSTPLTATE